MKITNKFIEDCKKIKENVDLVNSKINMLLPHIKKTNHDVKHNLVREGKKVEVPEYALWKIMKYGYDSEGRENT